MRGHAGWGHVFKWHLESSSTYSVTIIAIAHFSAGGKLTLAFFGRWPIYISKWARYCTVACVRDRIETEKATAGKEQTWGRWVWSFIHTAAAWRWALRGMITRPRAILHPTTWQLLPVPFPRIPPCSLPPSSSISRQHLWLRSPLEFLYVSCGVLFTPVDLHSSW